MTILKILYEYIEDLLIKSMTVSEDIKRQLNILKISLKYNIILVIFAKCMSLILLHFITAIQQHPSPKFSNTQIIIWSY